jgi:NAD(P)-dependent dehydrogenase (short-subunit alcohol dehydrogenase family)
MYDRRRRLAVSFQGKAALVTGAASGIGKETARRFAQKEARVLCADKNGEGAADLPPRLVPDVSLDHA